MTSHRTASSGRTFSVERDRIEVTMLDRADPSWLFVDAKGHQHRWYVQRDSGVEPAASYSPTLSFLLPTLNLVEDIPPDDEYPGVSHYECRLCQEHIQPRTCPDSTRQYIPGLSHYYIDDRSVDEATFKREWEAEQNG